LIGVELSECFGPFLWQKKLFLPIGCFLFTYRAGLGTAQNFAKKMHNPRPYHPKYIVVR
jgi:hypothetical protein